jgi:hypothetical protein
LIPFDWRGPNALKSFIGRFDFQKSPSMTKKNQTSRKSGKKSGSKPAKPK